MCARGRRNVKYGPGQVPWYLSKVEVMLWYNLLLCVNFVESCLKIMTFDVSQCTSKRIVYLVIMDLDHESLK